MDWLSEEELPPGVNSHPGWKRLEEQRKWYSEKGAHNQNWYRRIKVTQIILASAIPLLALSGSSQEGRWATAIVGAVIAVLEGLQQLNQYSRLWVEYQAMAERLKREKSLFLAGTGPYAGIDMDARLATLSSRVEDQLSTEHERWVANVGQTGAGPGQASSAAIGH